MREGDPFTDLIRSIEENLQRNGGWVPPDDGQPPPRPIRRPNRIWWLLLIPVLFFMFFNAIVGFLADWAWFASLDLSSILFTRVGAWFGLFLAGTAVAGLILGVNLYIVRRLEPHGLTGTTLEQVVEAFGVRMVTLFNIVVVGMALLLGLSIAGAWQDVLLYLNQVPFAVTDPLFGRNVGFYVFTLPILELARGWLMAVLIVTLLVVVTASGFGLRGWQARRAVLLQFGILGALILGLVAVGYQIDAMNLLFSQRGVVFGAGYTDVHAQLPAYSILTFVTLAAAVLVIVAVYLRQAWRAMLAVVAIWFVASIVAGALYPAFVQRFQVDPNELNLERPYIEDNISYTRIAYDLDEIDVRSYGQVEVLEPATLIAEPETIRNVRLWDYRPLLETYNQVQALRQQYRFNDADVDRYKIDGELRQVVLAAREMVPAQLDASAQTWVNLKLVYTHGFGVAMSPVELVTPDGLPEFYIKDLPPQGVIPVTQPQIYFGEVADSYVVGNTRVEEFDFPLENGYAGSHFAADTGIDMSLWNRLLFALRFADINLLLSQDITAESQLLWRRNIEQRVELLAPFLRFDRDPYVVVAEDGRLYWFLDAYTLTDHYPYSEPFNGQFNYIRNSVKVVIDAYTGETTFYVVDPEEPIAAAYRKIYPELFKPLSEIPPYLVQHIRYPTDLFAVQSQLYLTYHMINATDFYNGEDVWAWPQEMHYNQAQPMEPYYVLMQLPDEEKLEYMQILPFTPANRENMIAWLAARSDPAQYGEKIVYEFGKETLVFGPQQVEARIDQDPSISAQLSLWNQQGSSVIRGNLLVIPVGNSLLYVEPLYLQSDTAKIPQLKRVVLATAEKVVMAENLGLALVKLFGRDAVTQARSGRSRHRGGRGCRYRVGAGAARRARPPRPPSTSTSPRWTNSLPAANGHYERAQELLRSGDWSGYGAEMDALQATLQRLVEITGSSWSCGADRRSDAYGGSDGDARALTVQRILSLRSPALNGRQL